jgi:thioredoxin 1
MNSRRAGNRDQIAFIYLVAIAATLPLVGCAFNRASKNEIAAGMKPTAEQPAPTAQQTLPERSTQLASCASPVDEAPAASRGQGQVSPPSSPPIRLVSGESVSSNAQALPLQSPDLPVKIAQASPKPVSGPTERAVLHVSKATFEQQVLKSEVPVLVDFYARWCEPCKAIAPVIEELAQETPQARVVKVNIDDSPELAARYGVKSVPTLIVFKDGRVKAKQKGVISPTQLKAMLDL